MGFKMGSIVGGLFGGLMGTYYAITYRAFSYIPMGALGSGMSFGFFMGIGMIIRSEGSSSCPIEEENGE